MWEHITSFLFECLPELAVSCVFFCLLAGSSCAPAGNF